MVPRPAASAAELSPAERDRLWRALGAEGDAEAERAAKRLVAAGDGAVTALAPRLVPAAVPPTAEAVRRSIEALDSPDVDARDRATADLLHAGPVVEPQLRAALDGAPSAEARSRLEQVLRDFEPAGSEPAGPEGAETSGGARRDARVVQVLGDVGTPAAVEQLISLTAAPAAPELRREAKAALREIGGPRPPAAVEP
jgi:HEAT repeat protein